MQFDARLFSQALLTEGINLVAIQFGDCPKFQTVQQIRSRHDVQFGLHRAAYLDSLHGC